MVHITIEQEICLQMLLKQRFNGLKQHDKVDRLTNVTLQDQHHHGVCAVKQEDSQYDEPEEGNKDDKAPNDDRCHNQEGEYQGQSQYQDDEDHYQTPKISRINSGYVFD